MGEPLRLVEREGAVGRHEKVGASGKSKVSLFGEEGGAPRGRRLAGAEREGALVADLELREVDLEAAGERPLRPVL